LDYCSSCGGRVTLRIPQGDSRPRHVCTQCGMIHYQNPNMVVGAVCVWEDRILLARRAIAPREGFWTIPAGFLENGESTADGALREVFEEAGARAEIERLLAVYDIPEIHQVQIFYLARMTRAEISAGIESLEVGLFTWDEIPWGELAFPTVKAILKDWQRLHQGDAVSRRDFWRPRPPEPERKPELVPETESLPAQA
jgi:ADP-ribose pyrophosphatase YjhB (NUDIX family)